MTALTHCARAIVIFVLVPLVATVAANRAHAYTFKRLADFCQGDRCAGGNDPDGTVVIDSAGNLYGGSTADGTSRTFRLSPVKGSPYWHLEAIYRSGDPGLADGGEIYGLTGDGGAHGFGYIFALTPNAARTKWTEQTLYNFCPQFGCADGAVPNPSMVMDSAGRIFGTTERGGAFCPKQAGCGTAFMLTRKNGKWTHTVIHGFFDPAVKNDGAEPTAGVIVGAADVLYGTTSTGGAYKKGTVFQLKPNDARTKWTATVIHNFCAAAQCTDGDTPYGGLAMDGTGRLYGTTNVGGRNDGGDTGTVFMLTPNSARTKWTYRVIHKFCPTGQCATDGVEPQAGPVLDSAGNLFGMTPSGGKGGNGVVYELTPNSDRTKWTEKILYNFCATNNGCPDGREPLGGLAIDRNGNLFGTAEFGGNVTGGGVAFELVK